jgi:hypothetical protein
MGLSMKIAVSTCTKKEKVPKIRQIKALALTTGETSSSVPRKIIKYSSCATKFDKN